MYNNDAPALPDNTARPIAPLRRSNQLQTGTTGSSTTLGMTSSDPGPPNRVVSAPSVSGPVSSRLVPGVSLAGPVSHLGTTVPLCPTGPAPTVAGAGYSNGGGGAGSRAAVPSPERGSSTRTTRKTEGEDASDGDRRGGAQEPDPLGIQTSYVFAGPPEALEVLSTPQYWIQLDIGDIQAVSPLFRAKLGQGFQSDEFRVVRFATMSAVQKALSILLPHLSKQPEFGGCPAEHVRDTIIPLLQQAERVKSEASRAKATASVIIGQGAVLKHANDAMEAELKKKLDAYAPTKGEVEDAQSQVDNAKRESNWWRVKAEEGAALLATLRKRGSALPSSSTDTAVGNRAALMLAEEYRKKEHYKHEVSQYGHRPMPPMSETK